MQAYSLTDLNKYDKIEKYTTLSDIGHHNWARP